MSGRRTLRVERRLTRTPFVLLSLSLAVGFVTACGSSSGAAVDARPGGADVSRPVDAASGRDTDPRDAAPTLDLRPTLDACTPSCEGRDCGDDGCGGVCGTCGDGSHCDESFRCAPDVCEDECAPDGLRICDGDAVLVCGQHDDDVCLEFSAPVPCEGAGECIDGACVCEPSCADRACGDDGCGGDCGTCAGAQEACVDGACACQPACVDRDCGADGCGGRCGVCLSPLETCVGGTCVCTPDCAPGQCGDDGCGGTCPATCAAGQRCTGGHCLPCGDCGASDIEVVLQWDTDANLDLHVLAPGAEEVYSQHRYSSTGGALTLLSAPYCQPSQRAEIIDWPAGTAPPGPYRVLVQYYGDCGEAGATYTVTVRRCGREETRSGTFRYGEEHHELTPCCPDGVCDDSCVTLLSFDHDPSCSGAPAECSAAADCAAADDDACSAAACVAGRCVRTPTGTPGCCEDDCCEGDADCDVGDDCTAASCLVTGQCSVVPIGAEGCCEETLWTVDFDGDGADGAELHPSSSSVVWAWRVRDWPAVPSATPALHFGDAEAATFGGATGDTEGRIESPLLVLPRAVETTLSFRLYLDVEPGPTPDRFELSLLLGDRSFVVWRKDHATALRTWLPVTVDLSGLGGESIRVAWDFRTGDGVANQGVGVLLDDIALTSTCAVRACTADEDCADGLATSSERCDAAGTCQYALPDPLCADDAACDDGDRCTTDGCAQGRCVPAPVPGCCRSTGECDDGDPCTTDACEGTDPPRCTHEPLPGCCRGGGDCDDGNPCTEDVCPGEGRFCDHPLVAGCCLNGGTCDDDDPCTHDTCVAGRCENLSVCCATDGECDDGDDCTVDVCVEGRCVFEADAETPGCCEPERVVADFEDGTLQGFTVTGGTDSDSWRVIDAVGAPGSAKSLYYGSSAGAAYGDDSDGVATSPLWLLPSGQELSLSFRVKVDTESCCDELRVQLETEDGDVLLGEYAGTSDWQEVTTDLSVLAGTAVRLRFAFHSDNSINRAGVWVDDLVLHSTCARRPCLEEADCATEAPCVEGRCLGGDCVFERLSDCCATVGVCDDGDPCTVDDCAGGVCRSTPIPECCNAAADCVRESACVVGACVQNRCQLHCDPDCADCCLVRSDCDDGDACTADTCVANACVHHVLCCTSDAECDDGDDVCTVDSCVDQLCRSVIDPSVTGCCETTRVLADFEAEGRGSFETSGNGAGGDTWQAATDRVHGGAAALHYGGPDGADYARDTHGTAVSPPIAVPRGQVVQLSFWLYRELDWGDWLRAYADVGAHSFPIGQWRDSAADWEQATWDATWLAGRTFRLRFEVTSDVYDGGGGVWIDDVTLESTCAPRACDTAADCGAPTGCVDIGCAGGVCDYEARTGCCETDADCEDFDDCTTDACVADACVNEPIPGCCLADEACDDGIACTTNACVDHRCVTACVPGCADCCLSNAACDDGDPCTDDACVDHACLRTWVCCGVDADCDDGDDVCTTDVCADQRCRNVRDHDDPDCCAPTPFAWGFEDGTLGGFEVLGGSDEGDTWQVVSNRAHSGARSLYFGRGWEYGARAFGAARSPVLDLPPDQELTLSFWLTWALDGFSDEVVAYLDVDGGAWELGRWTQAGDWELFTRDISAWAGQPAQIRFRFGSDYFDTGQGVWIDDVAIESTCAPVVCRTDYDCWEQAGCFDWSCVDDGCRSEVSTICCRTDADCDDNDACTSDDCRGLRCSYGWYPTDPNCL